MDYGGQKWSWKKFAFWDTRGFLLTILWQKHRGKKINNRSNQVFYSILIKQNRVCFIIVISYFSNVLGFQTEKLEERNVRILWERLQSFSLINIVCQRLTVLRNIENRQIRVNEREIIAILLISVHLTYDCNLRLLNFFTTQRQTKLYGSRKSCGILRVNPAHQAHHLKSEKNWDLIKIWPIRAEKTNLKFK